MSNSPRDLDLLRDPARAASLLNPLRLRLLQHLRQPASAAALARKLDLPRQRLNYHLRELEKEGLVRLVEERKRGNCIERVLQASATSYLISPEVLGDLGDDPAARTDRFSSAYLVAVAAQAIREIAGLREKAAAADKRLGTFTLQTDVRFASAADRKAFTEELASAVARLAARYHDEDAQGGRRFRFLVGAYPAPAEEPPDEGSSS